MCIGVKGIYKKENHSQTRAIGVKESSHSSKYMFLLHSFPFKTLTHDTRSSVFYSIARLKNSGAVKGDINSHGGLRPLVED